MELLREIAPFLAGMVVPPILMLALRARWPGRLKFIVAFLPAVVLGIGTSAWAGELAGMPDSLISVMIDTSLVYTGSQLAYGLLWKPVLEVLVQHSTAIRVEQK